MPSNGTSRRSFLWAALGLPAFAFRIYDVREFGAKGDGSTVDTDAFVHALRAATDAGGGTVIVPAGRYQLTPFTLPSRVHLHLEPGSVLLSPTKLEAYPHEAQEDTQGESHRAGLITARDAESIAITGSGTVEANGIAFFDTSRLHPGGDWKREFTRQKADFGSEKFGPSVWPYAHGERPGNPIRFIRCKHVRLEGVTVQNSPVWHLNIRDCRDVQIRGLNINSLASQRRLGNDDGMDLTNCSGVRISDCLIETGDDCIAIFGSEDVIAGNCVLNSRSSGVRVGFSEGDSRRCIFHDLTVDANCAFKVNVRGPGSVEDISFHDMIVRTRLQNGHWWGKGEPIHVSAMPWKTNGGPLGHIRRINFRNIEAQSEAGIVLHGCDASRPEGIGLDQVRVRVVNSPSQLAVGGNLDLRSTEDLKQGLFERDLPAVLVSHARNVRLRDVNFEWDADLPAFHKKNVETEDVEGLELQGSGLPIASSASQVR